MYILFKFINSINERKNIIDKTYKNDDLNNFYRLANKVWKEYSKEKTYDECEKILLNAREEIVKKYDLKW